METHSFLRRNGLSLVLITIMLFAWGGQAYTGWKQHNEDRTENGAPPLSFGPYLFSDHFWSSTAENWESEFLQMGMYVLLTIGLRQRGSSESKKLDEKEEVDREPRPTPDAPWPVRKGGLWLALYRNSLSIAFALLFLLSFVVHLRSSWRSHNEELLAKGRAPITWSDHLGGHRFWFESFQNWQSEFLAVLAIVVLSIFLRQQGSPESKPVDAPHAETGK